MTRVCRLSDRYDDGPKDDAEIIANAQLLAAAPHLLAQIRWMVDAYSRYQTDDDPISREDWSMSLRAARQWLADHE